MHINYIYIYIDIKFCAEENVTDNKALVGAMPSGPHPPTLGRCVRSSLKAQRWLDDDGADLWVIPPYGSNLPAVFLQPKIPHVLHVQVNIKHPVCKAATYRAVHSWEPAANCGLFASKQARLCLNTSKQTSPPNSCFALPCVLKAGFTGSIQGQFVSFLTYRDWEDACLMVGVGHVALVVLAPCYVVQ